MAPCHLKGPELLIREVAAHLRVHAAALRVHHVQAIALLVLPKAHATELPQLQHEGRVLLEV